MSSRIKQGSVARDKRSNVWNFFWWENGKRKCKTLGRFPTKAAAWNAAKPLRDDLEKPPQPQTSGVPTVSTLVEQYRKEKMPKRKDTSRTYSILDSALHSSEVGSGSHHCRTSTGR